MELPEELDLRADVAAEAHLAQSLAFAYEAGPARFSDSEIAQLRETFKLGWVQGYIAAMREVQRELEEL